MASTIDFAIKLALRQAVKHLSYAEQQVLLNWPKIIGPEIASYSYPERLFDKVLYLQVGNSGHALKLQHMTDYLIEKIRCFCGKKVVEQIKIRQQYTLIPKREVPGLEIKVPDQSLRKEAMELSNPKLREAFLKLFD